VRQTKRGAVGPVRQHQIGAVDKVGERQIRQFPATQIETNVFDEHNGRILSAYDTSTPSASTISQMCLNTSFYMLLL